MLKRKTIKHQITLLVAIFTVFVSILVVILGIYFIYTTQRRTAVNSTEFNLRLVTNLVEQDLINLTALAEYSRTNPSIIQYLEDETDNNQIASDAFNQLREEYRINPSSQYVERLLVANLDGTKIMQIGTGLSASQPINKYNYTWIDSYLKDAPIKWDRLITDPFFFANDYIVIPYVIPITASDNNTVIGYAFVSVNPGVITDKLLGYSVDSNAKVYISLGSNDYRLSPGVSYYVQGRTSHIFSNVQPETAPYQSKGLIDDAIDTKATAEIASQDQKVWVSISYPIRDLISIKHMIPIASFFSGQTIWTTLLLSAIFLIIIFSMIITALFERTINTPILKLKQRMLLIGQGDFSIDKEIETNNELGEIGQGINQLTADFGSLLNKRLLDEKNKRDLEYRMLQSQINPHFLYNTLNSIKWMATIQNAEGIAKMTTALSHLMRCASKDTRKCVPLKEELQILDDYMLIQNYRYGNSIQLIKECDDEQLLDVLIPRFSLQPLVENSIFHGLEPNGGGIITVRITSDKQDVLISLLDNGVGISPDVLKSLKEDQPHQLSMFQELGVHSVNARMKYAFGESYGILINSQENEYTEMIIRIPFNTKMEVPNE